MQKVVVLTGAGISRESGLKTFRDGDGLWEGYNVQEVATPEAWAKNQELVQRFYNERRIAVLKAEPNEAHKALVSLESRYKVSIITQNIDDLHERAGSSVVLHLHGEILKSQSSQDPNLVYDVKGETIEKGDMCELGSQLRPNVVWFGEPVPMMDDAIPIVSKADILLIVGTSLVVYPAAGLTQFVSQATDIFVVDPDIPKLPSSLEGRVTAFPESASSGVPKVVDELLQSANAA